MILKQKPFDIGLLICLATDNFKASYRANSSLDLNENFTELKKTIKILFWHVSEKAFLPTNYVFLNYFLDLL